MEIVKSKRATVIVLIFGFIFFFGACSFAQIERMADSAGIIKRYSVNYISLKNPMIGESIVVGAYSDSIDEITITFSIYVYFPENINYKGKDIVITFADGTSDVFQQASVNQETGLATYETPYSINNIAFKEIKSILIRGVAKYDLHEQNKTFFKDFLASL